MSLLGDLRRETEAPLQWMAENVDVFEYDEIVVPTAPT
jgi:hypothetical protein